jgi:RND family efflux transporter MFP subunit
MITQIVHQFWPVLVDAAVREAVLLAAVLVLVFALRKAPAALRHLILVLALVGTLALPLLSLSLPRWKVLPAPSMSRLPLLLDSPISTSPSVSGGSRGVGLLHDATSASPQVASPARFAIDWVLVGGLVWLGGGLVVLTAPIAGIFRLWRIGARAQRVSDADWIETMRGCREQLGLSRRVILLRGQLGMMPMTWGVVSPKILLPQDSQHWPTERRTIVLLHELAHVKRWDCWSQWVANVARGAYWFNPLVWIAGRLAALESERACDQAVLAQGTRASDYAEQLLAAANGFKSSADLRAAAVAMARPSKLRRRIELILQTTRAARLGRWQIAAATAGLTALALPLAALRAQQAASAQTVSAQTQAANQGGQLLPRVLAVKAVYGGIAGSFQTMGQVVSSDTVTIRPRIGGQITKIAFQEGQLVQKGDVLVRLDPTAHEMVVQQAEANLEADKTVLKDAQEAVTLGKQEQRLGVEDPSSLSAQREKVDETQAAIVRDQAQLDSARLNLESCTITSPITGRIGLCRVSVGDFAQPSDPSIATVNATEPMMVEFSVPARDVASLEQAGNVGIGVSVEAEALNTMGNVLTGQIVAMDNQIDPNTGTLRVKASLSNKDGTLFPGQFVTVEVPEIAHSATTTQRGVLVPMEAVMLPPPNDPDHQPEVAIVGSDQRITFVRVNLGSSEDGVIFVTSGVQVGDMVVLPDRSDKVGVGERVKVDMTDQVAGHSWPVWEHQH